MSPPTTTTTSSPAPTAKPPTIDWNDFVSTIGTAIGPIITLFGEQATKQFLSMSMGWADNVLLAMGPIGIITIIVSATRIGGYRWLKTIIGRSRESRATAEQEFLSSTSEEVCELWSGRGISRVADKPTRMKDLVILQSNASDPSTGVNRSEYSGIMDAAGAFESDLLVVRPKAKTNRDRERVKEIAKEAPCIALNAQGTFIGSLELWLWVMIGILLQGFLFYFPAIATYQLKWKRKGVHVHRFAYPCFSIGTGFTEAGLLICGYVVHASTTVHTFRPSEKGKPRIQRMVRFQMESTVSGQHFPPSAIFNHPKNMRIRESRLNNKNNRLLAAVGSVAALSGFILQFIGLGSLHWSATVIMLGISLLMTAIRAWVRRGLARDPSCVSIPPRLELVWLALRAARNDWDQFLTPKPFLDNPVSSWDCEWCFLTGFIEPRLTDGTSILDQHHMYKDATRWVRQLSRLSGQEFTLGFVSAGTESQCIEARCITDLMTVDTNVPLGDYSDLASKLANAITRIVKFLEHNDGAIQWKGRGGPWRSRDWKVDVQQSQGVKTTWIVPMGSYIVAERLTPDLTAGLSLWMYSLVCGSDSLDSLDKHASEETSELVASMKLTPKKQANFVRIIGNSGSTTVEELKSWIAEGVYTAIPSYDGNWNRDLQELVTGGQQLWPIFGLHFSAALDMQAHPGVQTQKVFTFRKPEERPVAQDIIMSTVLPTHPVEVECALEMLSLFMISVCMYIDKVVDAGLLNDTNHALLYIIPAFAKLGLLPTLSKPNPAPGAPSIGMAVPYHP